MSAGAAHGIQLVVLRQSDCAAAIAQGDAYQSCFAAGVRIEATGIPIVVEPLAAKGAEGILNSRPFRLFACYPSAVDPNNWSTRKTFAPVQLTLTVDAMRILHTDLSSLATVPNEPARFDIGFVEEAYMPRTLAKLYEVAMAYWDCSRPGWTAPENERVECALQELETYKDKLAEAGATLLRRSFENWNQRHYELRKADGKLTPFESLVVVASAWKTIKGSPEDLTNENAQYREKAKAIEYWKSLDIMAYLAKYAWRSPRRNMQDPREGREALAPSDGGE